jgi:hypothetical protein
MNEYEHNHVMQLNTSFNLMEISHAKIDANLPGSEVLVSGGPVLHAQRYATQSDNEIKKYPTTHFCK